MKKVKISESQLKVIENYLIDEKLELKNWDNYVELVANTYEDLKDFDSSVTKHWDALNTSNHTLFKRLLSKVNVIFTTNDKSKVGSVNIDGREFKVEHINQEDEYQTASEMRNSFKETGVLKISIDYSEHPLFSVIDNIVSQGGRTTVTWSEFLSYIKSKLDD